jgi:hypothetical protein
MKYLLCILILFCIAGCSTQGGWYDEDTGVVLTEEEYATLTPAQRVSYEPIIYEQIKPSIEQPISAGLNTVNEGIKIVKPLIPEPFATGAVFLLGFLTTVWQLVSKKKIITRSDKITLGAKITGASVDAVVRGTELWKDFKKSQNEKKENTEATMPNEL